VCGHKIFFLWHFAVFNYALRGLRCRVLCPAGFYWIYRLGAFLCVRSRLRFGRESYAIESSLTSWSTARPRRYVEHEQAGGHIGGRPYQASNPGVLFSHEPRIWIWVCQLVVADILTKLHQIGITSWLWSWRSLAVSVPDAPIRVQNRTPPAPPRARASRPTGGSSPPPPAFSTFSDLVCRE
jgi:hypothetical protein